MIPPAFSLICSPFINELISQTSVKLLHILGADSVIDTVWILGLQLDPWWVYFYWSAMGQLIRLYCAHIWKISIAKLRNITLERRETGKQSKVRVFSSRHYLTFKYFIWKALINTCFLFFDTRRRCAALQRRFQTQTSSQNQKMTPVFA